MSIKLLHIFVTVYKEGSITVAAKRLNLSQPAVSAAIKELETRYQVALFERVGRGIQRTSASHQLYEYASHITALYTEMDSEFQERKNNRSFRVGTSISIGTCLLPPLLKSYLDTYQTPMPYVKIDSSDLIEKMVLSNSLDFAVIEGCIHSDQILSEPLLKDHLVLVCGRDHYLAKHRTVRIDDIRHENFLLREKNSGTREQAESTLLLNDFLLHPTMESTSTTAIIHGVMEGLGLSILPERMLTEYFRKHLLVKLQIEGIEFSRDYRIVYHQNKYLSPEVTQFMDFLKQNIDHF